MYKSMFYKLEELIPSDVIMSIGENDGWLRLDTKCLIDLDIITSFWNSKLFLNKKVNNFTPLIEGRSFTLEPKNKKYIKLYNMIEKLIKEGTLKSINTLQYHSSTRGFVFIANMNTQDKPLIR